MRSESGHADAISVTHAGAISVALQSSLRSRRVVVTRPASQSESLTALLRSNGANVVHLPVIAIAPPADDSLLRNVLANVETFDWIVFTSANAVQSVATRIPAGARRAHSPKLAAVGRATAVALRDAGFPVDHLSQSTGRALATELPLVEGCKVLLPQSNVALREVACVLRERGAEVTEVVAYITKPSADALALVRLNFSASIDAVIFTSPSTVFHFFAALAASGFEPAELERRGTKWVCIGPTTARALDNVGIRTYAVAERPDNESLVAATAGLFHD